MAEIKAAYLVKWPQQNGIWAEVIFHGLRSTPDGMASLTPYFNNHMQLHGMTEQITLFKDGLSKSSEKSAQPQINQTHLEMVESGWPEELIKERTQNSIDHIVELIPSFKGAKLAGPPLFGIQQIPGDNPSNRTADASFEPDNYARIETIKLSSTLTAARKIIEKLELLPFPKSKPSLSIELSYEDVIECAKKLAVERGYPSDLAQRIDAN